MTLRPASEPLEKRQLLTFVLNGTPQDDFIQMFHNGSGAYQFILNGQDLGTTSEGSVLINGLGGNDNINVDGLGGFSNHSVTVRGGAGNDIYNVGNGVFAADITGHVHIEEQPGEGNDVLTVRDQGSGSGHQPMRVFNNRYTADVGGIQHTVDFDDNLETKYVDFSSLADDVVVESVPVGMRLLLGDGANVVRFGGAGHVINGDLTAGYVEGGSNTDTVLFDDSNGDSSVRRDYLITNSAFMNQSFAGIDDVQLTGRQNFTGGDDNAIVMTGDGTVLHQITLDAPSDLAGVNATTVSIGTESAPVDLDDMSLLVDVKLNGSGYEIWDQDTNGTNDPWILVTIPNPNRQVVAKGACNVRFSHVNNAPPLFLEGGSTNDIFAIGAVLPNSAIAIDGNDGDDEMHTFDFQGGSHALDTVFTGSSFAFFGGPGIDRLSLDESQDPLGGVADYTFSGAAGSCSLYKGNRRVISYGSSVDELTFIANNDPNTIRFNAYNAPGGVTQRITVDAKGGDDVFTNFDPELNAGDLSSEFNDVTLIGGPGLDRLDLNDASSFSDTSRYNVTSSAFSYVAAVNNGSYAYDSSLETFNLDQNALGTQTHVDSKPLGMTLNVSGLGGDDAFFVGGGDIDSHGFTTTTVTLSGGAGVDSITFEDRLDAEAFNEAESYTFDTFTLTKGSTSGFTYSSFDAQTLDTADRIVGTLFVGNTINVNAVSSFFASTTINGGVLRDNTINLGNGNLTNLSGSYTLNFNAAGGELDVNDQNATVNRIFELNASQFIFPIPVTFTGAQFLNINAGPLNDSIFIEGSAAGTTVVAHGNNGDDKIGVGAGSFDSLFSPISIFGNAGTDEAQFAAHNDPDFVSETLTSSTFTSGLTHTYSTFEKVTVAAGSGGSNIAIQSVPILTPNSITSVIGGIGDDVITIGAGNVGLRGNISVDGRGTQDSDTLILDDSTSGGDVNYTFDLGNRFFKEGVVGSPVIVNSHIERQTLRANRQNNIVTVDSVTNPLTILANDGNDTINVLDSGSPVTVNTGTEFTNTVAPFGDSISVNSDFTVAGDTPATVIVDQDDTVLGLGVFRLGTLRIPTGGALNKVVGSGSTFTLTGTIDLYGGALLSRGGGPSVFAFETFVRRGYNSGGWNGTSNSGAINSSLAAGASPIDAVGYALGSETAIGSIGSFSIAPTDVVLRYTFFGDTDLNQRVNFDDYVHTDSGFNNHRTEWTNGDFDYNGLVNFDDYVLIDQAFNAT
jgi:hypothetical protein